MSGPPRPPLEDLLLDRALHGLDGLGRDDLDHALADEGGVDLTGFERAAAALHEGWAAPEREALPAGLNERLLQQGLDLVRAGGGDEIDDALSGAAGAPRGESAPSPRPLDPPTAAGGSAPVMAWAGWLAAAGILAWALVGPGFGPAGESITGASLAELEAEIRSRPDTVLVDWNPTEDELGQGVSGDVVWNTDAQRGLMHFRGLDPNDPDVAQYQLWIFDEGRQHPVDGGVFDVPASGEVVVPIAAKLRIGKPVLFAVTLEEPGGVVVSERERLLLTAEVL